MLNRYFEWWLDVNECWIRECLKLASCISLLQGKNAPEGQNHIFHYPNSENSFSKVSSFIDSSKTQINEFMHQIFSSPISNSQNSYNSVTIIDLHINNSRIMNSIVPSTLHKMHPQTSIQQLALLSHKHTTVHSN